MDPRFRTLYPTLDDAPKPVPADGFVIAVSLGRDWVQDYESAGGEWKRSGQPYVPATADNIGDQ